MQSCRQSLARDSRNDKHVQLACGTDTAASHHPACPLLSTYSTQTPCGQLQTHRLVAFEEQALSFRQQAEPFKGLALVPLVSSGLECLVPLATSLRYTGIL